MSVRWGIAGTGRMAEVFARDLALVPDAELVAVGSRDAAKAQAFADEFGAPSGAGRGYRALVESDDVDVVYIATPHPQHHALALSAIEAGCPLLVEKAFTATLAGAEEVVGLARERGVFCMEAMWTRFQPATVRARELVASGAIGEVFGVQATLGAYRPYDPDSRLFAPELGGGATLDLGVYVVSIAQHFLGDPDRVVATGTLFPNGVDASASILMTYDDGRAGSLVCSLAGESPRRATIFGTGGSIELGPQFHRPTELVLRLNGEQPEVVDLPAVGSGYTHEIDEVHRCLGAGLLESDVMPLADTLAVQRVLQETLEAIGVPMREDDSAVI